MGMTNNMLYMIKAISENDLQRAKKYALCCCDEDTTQKNRIAVLRYKEILSSPGMNMLELPHNISAFARLEDVSTTYIEGRYYLTEDEKELFELIRDMNDVAIQLMEKRIPYLNATLLYGESGVGKTEFSKYVAYKLGLPYLYVNFSRMMDSYLGGTSKNLTALFKYINEQKCVVMLDELDSMAISRKYADSSAGAEISRSTTCLLQLLDSVTNDHVIIGATNLIDDIDSAVKRRFTEKHEMKRLSADERYAFIEQYMESISFKFDDCSAREYAKENHSQAEIMTYMTRRVAQALLKKEEVVMF